MKHTPGPWKKRPHFTPAGNAIVVDSSNIGIAGVFGKSHEQDAEANAALIAAAPELLEACKMILPYLQSNNGYGADQIEAAIAKAEGPN